MVVSIQPLLPATRGFSGSKDLLEAGVKEYVGKTIQVLLPLQIEDIINEYIFTLEIKNVEIK